MVSSSRQAIACILLIIGAAVYSRAQTNPAKAATASITGKVTVKGKGVSGIVITAQDPVYRGGWETSRYRATTDASGEYRIANLPAGTYRLMPHAMAFSLESDEGTKALIVGEGETIEDINFALVRGGVITGKITDADGQPLVEENITLMPIEDRSDYVRMPVSGVHTDDRGVYRAFGLREGKYKVSAGYSDRHLPGFSRAAYSQTFHPSTTDEAKATIIEVTAGGEVKNVDIVMASRSTTGTFKVTGRVVDGQTGKPLADVGYGITQSFGEGNTSSMSGSRTNAGGEFKFENVLPGKYSVYIERPQNSDMRANPVAFEVTDRDIKDLVIRTVKGASVSGVVVLDGTDERVVIKQPGGMHIFAWVEDPDNPNNAASAGSLQPDGSFRIGGLRGGTARISLGGMRGSSGYGIVRLERDGVTQPDGIIIKDGEDIGGLRLVLRRTNGAIRGQVKIEDGPLPPSARLVLSVTFLDDPSNSRSYRSEEVDPRGRFHIQGLPAGRYIVRVNVYMVGPSSRPIEGKQDVTVTENSTSEVVLTVKLKADPDEDDDDP